MKSDNILVMLGLSRHSDRNRWVLQCFVNKMGYPGIMDIGIEVSVKCREIVKVEDVSLNK